MAKDVCEYCGKSYVRWQYRQRFCCGPCNVAWHMDERRQAVKLLRSLRAKTATEDERALP
jgi:hypothetical protein